MSTAPNLIIIFMDLNMISVDEMPPEYASEVQLLKVLTHPARLAILEILRQGEQCVCHMEAHLGYRQAYISQQLAVLRQAGLIQDRREGWNIYYRVAQPDIYQVLDAVQKLAQGDAYTPRRFAAQAACPCPKCASAKKA